MSAVSLADNMAATLAEAFELLPAGIRPAQQLGNRCGHDPKNPHFEMIESTSQQREQKRKQDVYGKKLRPLINRMLGEHLKDVYADPEKHWTLTMHKRAFDCITASRRASLRLIRSEAREAQVRALAVMVLHMDLSTMLVGYYDQFNQFKHYTYDWLAAQAGMSLSRFERAIAFWKGKGIIRADKKVAISNDDGTWSGRACPKRIVPEIFTYFSLDNWLKDERLKASARLKERKEEGAKALLKRETAIAKAQANKAKDDALRDLAAIRDGRQTGDKRIDEAASAADILKSLA